jgi:uncharacterized membrane protein
MKRYLVLYLATALVMLPLDLLFLGVVAKGFFNSQVGDMLGKVRLAPAILFYLIYVGGIVLFVNGAPGATWQSAAMFGALFGFVCYATFELTAMSLLKHWTWSVVAVDMAWGTMLTAIVGTLGLVLGNWVLARLGLTASEACSPDGAQRNPGTRSLSQPRITP